MICPYNLLAVSRNSDRNEAPIRFCFESRRNTSSYLCLRLFKIPCLSLDIFLLFNFDTTMRTSKLQILLFWNNNFQTNYPLFCSSLTDYCYRAAFSWRRSGIEMEQRNRRKSNCKKFYLSWSTRQLLSTNKQNEWNIVHGFLSRINPIMQICEALLLFTFWIKKIFHIVPSKCHWNLLLNSRKKITIHPALGDICNETSISYFTFYFKVGSAGTVPLAVCLWIHFINSQCLAVLHIVLMASNDCIWCQQEYASLSTHVASALAYFSSYHFPLSHMKSLVNEEL